MPMVRRRLPAQYGRLSTTSIRTTAGMVRSKPYLIPQQASVFFCLANFSNLWILLLQPLAHLLRILVEAFPHRVLRCETPLAKYPLTVYLDGRIASFRSINSATPSRVQR
jgi:hypothetical protein